jgi:cytochrome bd-type quinol oxidase subunit 2
VLEVVWFVLIAVWSATSVLEGFDFGVGMLCRSCRAEREREVMLSRSGRCGTNEVRLSSPGHVRRVSGVVRRCSPGSTWRPARAVPLIVRVVSFEWREKGEGTRWRVWLAMNALGSYGVPLLWDRCQPVHGCR